MISANGLNFLLPPLPDAPHAQERSNVFCFRPRGPGQDSNGFSDGPNLRIDARHIYPCNPTLDVPHAFDFHFQCHAAPVFTARVDRATMMCSKNVGRRNWRQSRLCSAARRSSRRTANLGRLFAQKHLQTLEFLACAVGPRSACCCGTRLCSAGCCGSVFLGICHCTWKNALRQTHWEY